MTARDLSAWLSREFLSCLSGSDDCGGDRGFVGGFLSCLSGSDVDGLAQAGVELFLSCLSGSDEPGLVQARGGVVSELPIRQ